MTEAYESRFCRARRNYIASRFPMLNEMQLQGVLKTQGPVLLLAGAGSGKTTVLINRIANLLRYGCGSDCDIVPEWIEERDVEFLETLPEKPNEEELDRADALCAVDPPAPWSVLAITFTNKAANELKERLASTLGDRAQSVWAMTFHSACCRILRRDIEPMGYTRSFTIYDAADSERLLKEITRQLELDDKTFPPRYVAAIIGRQKDERIDPEEMYRDAQSKNDLKRLHIARIYARYQERLKENNALDFDDIIRVTVELLERFPDVLAYYQRRFRYVLVDEYQDTNRLQNRLTELLAGGRNNLCVVGDDDQSIYRFRGATIDNILHFEERYDGCCTIRLEQNYRSTQTILEAANAVIANNVGRKGKRLWTRNDRGCPITVYQAATEGAEGNFVAGQILARGKDESLSDYAVLYRTNAQSNALEYAFKRNGIPYRVIGGMRFFERAEIKDILAYLCVVNNPNDDLRLLRIINNPPRGLGAKSLETAQRLAQAEQKPLFAVISQPENYASLEKSAEKLRQFTALIARLQDSLANGLTLPEFYDELLVLTGYAEMLHSKPTEENKTKLENVLELKSSVQTYIANTEEPTLAGFLEEIALYTDIEEYQPGDDVVVMMTMHAAKGLEFPNVFLVGMEDGLFPSMRAQSGDEEMEEERRLCYVAITRAKKKLTLSYAHERMIYGHTSATKPSRFLNELPENLVTHRGGYHAHTMSAPAPRKHYSGDLYEKRPTAPSSGGKMIDLSPGQLVEHVAFGRGMVLTVVKMGGDALLEIAFDNIGTKKLMAKTAGQFMKKLS